MGHQRYKYPSIAMLIGLLATASAWAQQKLSFDIPEQNASTAIQLWARQAGLQVFAADEHLRGVRTRAVRGDYAPLDAARLLMDGTGLEVVSTGEKTVTIRRPNGNGTPKTSSRESLAGPPTADSLEEVVITGSRIKRAGFDTLQPALVAESAEIERRGYVNIAQALEATPGFMPGDNSTGNQGAFGAGQNFVNFFGLGTNRTLTLVNGRRFVSSNTVAGGNANTRAKGQQVDMNVIPAGLVSRVETIAIGGAPIYGADAIAGTVNVILKDNFQGIETSVQYGMAEPGDAETQAYRLMLGGNFGDGRGNAVLGVEYNEQEGLLASDRFVDYRRRTNPADTGPNDGIPALQVVEAFGLGSITEGGLPFIRAPGTAPGHITAQFPNGNYIRDAAGAPLKFGPDSTLVPYVLGTVTGTNPALPGVPFDVSGGDRLDPARHTSLIAPAQRTLLNGIAHYDLMDNVRFFVEAAYAQSEGQELSELAAFAGPTVSGTSITLSVNNPFLPAQARDTLLANGVTDTFSLSRNLSDIVDRMPSETTIDLHRLVGGFQGNFDAFGEQYNWDVSYNYGSSQAETKQAYINNTRFLEAIDAVSAGGQIVCRSGNVACAPLNLFGEGAPSDAAIGYVIDRGIADSTNTQKVMTVNLGGNLPFGIAGPIGFNIGSEYRREEGSFVVDGTLRAGATLLGAGLAGAYVGTEGHYHTREGYTELVVPLVADDWNLPVVKALTFEGAARYVDNSLAGGATTWSAGTKFAPRLSGWGDGLMFRGVFTHAIRGPAITELFAGQIPTQTTLGGDPCNRVNYNQGPNPTVRQANCAAALAAVGAPPPGVYDNSATTATSTVRGFQQGNPNLQNEIADSWSIGLVYQPTTLPQLRLALDWVNISLEDAITSLNIGTLLTQCYDNEGLSNPACAAFERLTAAQAASQLSPRVAGDIAHGYRTGFFNTSSRDFAGAILAAEYAFNVRDAHRVRLSTTAFYIDKDDSVAFTGQDTIEAAGTFGVPDYRVQANVGYSWRWLDVDWQTQWTDSMILDRDATLETQPFLEFGSYTISSATFGLRLGENYKAQVGVSNVFDKEVPLVGLAVSGFRQYDPIGRRYFATFRVTF